MKTPKPNPDNGIPLELYAGSPQGVRDALAKIRAGKPLTTWEVLAVARILEQVLDGYDACKDLGITHKPGAWPTERGKHVWMATHYWKIYDPKTGWKISAGAVASAWGGEDKTAYNIAQEYKEEGLKESNEVTIEQILEAARIYASL